MYNVMYYMYMYNVMYMTLYTACRIAQWRTWRAGAQRTRAQEVPAGADLPPVAYGCTRPSVHESSRELHVGLAYCTTVRSN